VRRSRPAVDLADVALSAAVDESDWDVRTKKLFLFGPERVALSLDRLAHYTGTAPESFQRYVLFTNYAMHVEAFRDRFADAEGPESPVQMPAWHHRAPGNTRARTDDRGHGDAPTGVHARLVMRGAGYLRNAV